MSYKAVGALLVGYPRAVRDVFKLDAHPLSDTSEAQEEHRELKYWRFSISSGGDIKLSAHGMSLVFTLRRTEVGVARRAPTTLLALETQEK